MILIAYAQMTTEEARRFKPSVVFVDADNTIVELGADPALAPVGSGLITGR